MSHFDGIVVGGGPAGISAACWLAELNLSALLIESANELGGQLLRTYNPIKNHLGIETENGRELRDIFLKQMANWKFETVIGESVSEVDLIGKRITTIDANTFTFNNLIIATGVSRRKLDIPGEEELIGKGILVSGARDSETVRGQTVCVVGGGDAALENSLILAETAKKVTLVYRGGKFRGRDEFIEKVTINPKIEVLMNSNVIEIIGSERLEGVKISGASEFVLPIDSLIVRIGVKPNTELFRGKLELDRSGFIKTDHNCETNIANIFAIGDVSNALAPTISSAVGMGATVAKIIRSRQKT